MDIPGPLDSRPGRAPRHAWRSALAVVTIFASMLALPSCARAGLESLLGVVSWANSVAVQDDGKIVVAGITYSEHAYPIYKSDLAVVRYNSDGTPDASFGVLGAVTTDLGNDNDEAFDLAIQSDGKIVAVGISGSALAVVRYLADGELDAGFGVGGVATASMGQGNAVAIQPDGRIVVCGSGLAYQYGSFAVARFDPDGSLDTTFDLDGIVEIDPALVDRGANDVAIGQDGKIIAVGGRYALAIVHLDSDGSFDAGFDGDGMISAEGFDGASGVAIQGDGKFVVAAAGNDSYYSNHLLTVLRYNPDGTLDSSFSGDGISQLPIYIGLNNVRFGIAVASDGSIVISGDCDDVWALVKFTAAGTFDTSFDTDGITFSDLGADGRYANRGACALALENDDAVVTAGRWTYGWNETIAITRHNPDGSPDSTFDGEGALVESDCRRFPLDASSCLTARKSALQMRWSDKSSLKWKWAAGETFAQAELGTPEVDARYTLCVYDASGVVPRLSTWFDLYGESYFNGGWTDESPVGWSYDGGTYGNIDSVRSVRLRASGTGGPTSASIRVVGYYDTPLLSPVSASHYLDEDSSLIVQLVGSNGFCLTSGFSVSGARENDGVDLKIAVRE